MLSSHSPKILIRSYFYARLRPLPGVGSPQGWKSFIGQVCDYVALHEQRGRDQIRKYLCERFTLRFVSTEDLENLVLVSEVEALAEARVMMDEYSNRLKGDSYKQYEVELAGAGE